ncbi:MAG: hypothetical protein ABFS19_06295 [Thermodesulfobacteriota bacterium]
MKQTNTYSRAALLLFLVSLLFFSPSLVAAAKSFGGLTFLGDRQGICIQIAGECAAEDIQFELATCDANQVPKKKFQERMPFTLLVPVGTHELVIKKGDKVIRTDSITVESEKVLEYRLP